MTRDDVMTLSGSDLDDAVHKALFLPKPPTTIAEARAQGWRRRLWEGWDGRPPPTVRLIDDSVYPPEVVPYEAPLGWAPYRHAYSASIANAWIVVEHMSIRVCDFWLERAGTLWFAAFGGVAARGDSAPEAICRAALVISQEAGA
jgi:hypothetical protein